MTNATRLTADAAAFGRILQRLRMAQGWTIAELARRTGYNKNHLRLLEHGQNMPSFPIVFVLAEVLQVEAADIVREVELARRERRARRAAAMLSAAGLAAPAEQSAG